MSEKEITDHPVYIRHYKIALATGLTKEAAKRVANHQFRENYDLSHLRVKS